MSALTAALLVALVVASPAASTLPTGLDAAGRAEELVRDVVAYSAGSPGAPGSIPEWVAGDVTPGRPILIHSYPALEPVFYYVPLESPRASEGGFVTLDAVTGKWQAYGRCDADLPPLTRKEAAAAAGRETGSHVDPTTLRAVSMPDRNVYWHWRSTDGSRELFVNAWDPSDVRTLADETILSPPPGIVRGRRDVTVPPTRDDEAVRNLTHARTRYPDAHDLDVPFYYQQTASMCGPATDQMVMDYWGPAIGQQHIAEVANTDDVGTSTGDMMRAAHFSAISTAIQNPDLHGYDERKLGYGALECNWRLPDQSDPDYPDRHNDLKRLVSFGYPLIMVTKYDAGSYGTHARVLKGYDDNTDVYIVHDPWYSGIYQGPDVHFNQTFLVDELWMASRMLGILIAPWEVTIEVPVEVLRGTRFTVTAHVVYRGPHPFDAQDSTLYSTVRLLPSELWSLPPGEYATKALHGWFSDSGCRFDPVTWELVADSLAQAGVIEALARGLLHDSSDSYTSYSDSIGGRGEATLTISDPSRVTVDAAGSGYFTRIQDALDFAARGDTVEVLPGTYTGPGNRDLTFNGRNVVLRGVRGPRATVIDCEGEGRGFNLTESEGRETIIDGFTVANGAPPVGTRAGDGGAIFLDGASPTIRNVVLEHSSASGSGGGVHCQNGAAPLLEGCVLWKNAAAQTGGALSAVGGSVPELVSCTLALNEAPDAGGVFCDASSPLLTDTIIYGCPSGAAMVCTPGSAPSLVHCCVQGNAGGDDLPASCGSVCMIASDPLFCDPERGALQLQECSPCIGAGVSGGDVGGCPPRCACANMEVTGPDFFFHAPHPSPFRSSTALSLDVPADARHVTMAIYNAHGQRVKTLIDGHLPSGRRTIEWAGDDDDGRPVSAGVYFVRCSCGASEGVQKLVLVR